MIKKSTQLLGVGALALSALIGSAQAADTVKVGVLHSLSGTMAISETSLRDVLLFTADEINAKGGVLGKKIELIIVDGASDWPTFAEKAKQLTEQDKVAVTFGCWTSVSRKYVLPVLEKNNALLFYPVQYEGEEESQNVIYTAEAVNQQATPAVDYYLAEGKKKFYLLGSDYVYPQTTNLVLLEYLLSKEWRWRTSVAASRKTSPAKSSLPASTRRSVTPITSRSFPRSNSSPLPAMPA